MKRYCFPSEEIALEKLFEAGYMTQEYELDEETGEPTPVGLPKFPHNMKGSGFDLMILGTISKPTGVLDEDDSPVMEALPGWHVDILTSTSAECLVDFLVEPKNPVHCV